MKLNYFSVLLIVFAIAAKGCAKESSINNPADIKAIEEVSAERAKAFNNGDAEGIAIHFTDTGVLMAPGSPAKIGRNAVREYYQGIFDEFSNSLNSYYEEVRVSGNLAIGQGVAEVISVPHEGGDTLYSTSKYINILERQPNGTWQTTHDIWNDNE
ncbi:MAG: SgcJ/EcaC family oxidoreductase [Balneolaceae bacterium]|nr:SgcJ/EcaC family oxidoreductase [Balneolaceae bacterium]